MAKWDAFINVNTPDDLATGARHRGRGSMTKTVAIGGLGAIGLKLARALDAGVDGLQLIAVAARDHGKGARRTCSGFRAPPRLVSLRGAGGGRHRCGGGAGRGFRADRRCRRSRRGRIFVPASVGALLPRMHLVKRAKETGARIVVPTGALLGLDAVRAAAEGAVESVTIESRKPPRGLEGAPYLVKHGIDVSGITAPQRVFEGNAFDAAAGFPANVNVAAALALAGIGPDAHACGDLGRSRASTATCIRSAWRRRPRGSA